MLAILDFFTTLELDAALAARSLSDRLAFSLETTVGALFLTTEAKETALERLVLGRRDGGTKPGALADGREDLDDMLV